jgi:hypothetical protein
MPAWLGRGTHPVALGLLCAALVAAQAAARDFGYSAPAWECMQSAAVVLGGHAGSKEERRGVSRMIAQQ